MFGLYLHIPFCRQKCSYCDFYSVPERPDLLAAYPGLLRRQLDLSRHSGLWTGPINSVFFGGGTPSLLPPEAIASVLEGAAAHFGLAPGAEVTLEANPGTVTEATLAGYRAAGVNRLSLGIQSLNDLALQRLGRLHDAAAARRAVGWARAAGFTNLSCDLIYALPEQDAAALDEEIEALLELAPEHLSTYALTVEEGTPLAAQHRARPLPFPDEDLIAAGYRQLDRTLTEAGYEHYEISNFARPGRECRHNQATWRREAYLGIGAGAHSFLASGWGQRLAVPADLSAYGSDLTAGLDPAKVLETFDRRGAMAETLYLGLRTSAGVSEADFSANFGAGVATAFAAGVRRAGHRLALRDGCWRFDLSGWLLFDHLIVPFL